MKRFLLSTVAAAVVSMPAFAADLVSTSDYVAAPAPSASTWAAYFDVHGGYGFGDQSGDFDLPPFSYDEDYDEGILGAAMRAAYFFSPSFSVQGDVWVNSYDGDGDGTNTDVGDYDFDFNDTFVGAGGHLTYNIAPGTLIGALASYGWAMTDGDDNDSEFANIGIEAAHEFGNFRAYGQGGYTFATGGYAEDSDADAWYAATKLTYYFNDNFAVSGNLAYSEANGDGDETDLSWGATFEAKPWELPVSLYASYVGYHWEGDESSDDWDGTEHAFLVGATFLLNAPTVRERDRTVGLKDMNPIFGDLP